MQLTVEEYDAMRGKLNSLPYFKLRNAHLEGEVKKLRAKVAELKKRNAVPEWQPIETAPKDGTRILVTADDHIHAAHYDKTYSSPWRITDGFGWSVGTPDCWMPLPAAPKPEELK